MEAGIQAAGALTANGVEKKNKLFEGASLVAELKVESLGFGGLMSKWQLRQVVPTALYPTCF